jgi:hypothetical protein
MHSDGRAVISDFELAVNGNDTSETHTELESISRVTKEDESVYISPEVSFSPSNFFSFSSLDPKWYSSIVCQ